MNLRLGSLRIHLNISQIIALTFLGIILLGTILLALPVSSADNQSCGFLGGVRIHGGEGGALFVAVRTAGVAGGGGKDSVFPGCLVSLSRCHRRKERKLVRAVIHQSPDVLQGNHLDSVKGRKLSTFQGMIHTLRQAHKSST